MGLKVYLNGELVDKKDAKISIFDHGLLYGDGIFEGIRSYDCLIFQLKEHLDRLFKSAGGIQLNIPITKGELEKAIIETLKANKLKDAYIRLVVTRGIGDLGLDPYKCKAPSVFIITDKIMFYPKEFYESGLKIIVANIKRNNVSALPPTIKSLNYLNNILAKLEAIKAGVEEALMFNADGYACECTGDNIFIVKGNKLITPSIEAGALEGITRNVVMEIAHNKNIEVKEELLRLKDLYDADECFLTGTAAEIIPVTEIDDCKIGNGHPGKLTSELIKEFREKTKREGIRYAL